VCVNGYVCVSVRVSLCLRQFNLCMCVVCVYVMMYGVCVWVRV